MAKSKVVFTVVTLGTVSLALAACGSSSSSSSSSSASVAPSASGNGTLTIGTPSSADRLIGLPLGPPEFAGVELAVKEINANGGVLGKPVTLINGDSGDTSTNIASQTVDRLVSQGADAIIGAASSSVTLSVIDKVTNAGVAMVSPANTRSAE